jgi:ABC-2 type transport system ATP-binding protein
MAASNDLLIQTTSLSKSYDEVHAVKALDLEVPEHSIFGFLGPNGAGKTTTIKLLLGLARPSAGSGTIFGQDIVRDSISGGTGNRLTLKIPQDTGVSVNVNSENNEVTAEGFKVNGRTYTNDAYGTSDVYLNINIDFDRGQVTLDSDQ